MHAKQLIIIATILISLTSKVAGFNYELEQSPLKGGNHDPIYINGNDEFTPENGITGGSGLEGDPYLIENWEIEGDGVNNQAISISNTDAYFIIKNCTITKFNEFSGYQKGIYFFNVKNGVIENTVLFQDYIGVYIQNSSTILIKNCLITEISHNYAKGIYLLHSTKISIQDCDLSEKRDGIRIDDGVTDTYIENSTIHNNEDNGIFAWNSHTIISNITIKNCYIHDNGDLGINLFVGDRNLDETGNVNIDRCVLFRNGLPPPGIANGDPAISTFLFHQTNITNCTLYNNGRGIEIGAKNCIIKNCRIYNHILNTGIVSDGIAVGGMIIPAFRVYNTDISYCDIYNNEGGILTWAPKNLSIHHNKIYGNINYGIDLFMFTTARIHDNNIFDNAFSEWFSHAVTLSLFSRADLRNNWWGSSTGPSNLGPGSGDSIEGFRLFLRFKPWAESPIPDAGAG